VVTDTKARPRQRKEVGLTPEQLSEVLGLIKGADSVELKLSVPDADRRSTVAALALDPLDAQIRQVVFFDTPDLVLNQHGVVVRGRRVQGREGDAIIKLRPVVPDELPAALRKDPLFGVEVDAMPGGFVCSATLKSLHKDATVKSVFTGGRPIRKLFSKEQRAFFAAHAPEGLEMDALSQLGPINVLKLKFNPPDFGRRMVAELWFYPDGFRLLELSTKCPPRDAFGVAAEAKAYLGNHGVDLLAEQQTKTKTALQFYAKELATAGTATA
jgi:hypothetical protein